jgi:hypothetical protein
MRNRDLKAERQGILFHYSFTLALLLNTFLYTNMDTLQAPSSPLSGLFF